MHIPGPKRTKRIDADREVLLANGPNGPIWTTAGATAMSGDDNAALSANLKARARQSEVEKATYQVQQMAAAFLESTLLQIAPQNVLADYLALQSGSTNGLIFTDWLKSSGWAFHQDGLRTVITLKGKEIAHTTAKVDPRLESDILSMLRIDASLARLEEASTHP